MTEDSASAQPKLLSEREELVANLVRGALACSPVLSVITGEGGSGRSTVLDAISRDLAAEPVRVLRLWVTEGDAASPCSALYRLLIELEQEQPGRRAATEDNPVRGLVARLGAGTPPGAILPPETAGRLAASVFTVLRRHGPVVLLIDDAQHLDPATASLVDQLVRRCSGGECSIIATWRGNTPADPTALNYAAVLSGSLATDLIRTIPLRPLTRGATAALIAQETAAVPDDELVDRFHRLARGNPSAVRTALDGARADDALRVVDQHVYLVHGPEAPTVPTDHPLLARLRQLPPTRERVAAAMAVLCPIGDSAVPLVADALNLSENAVLTEIAELVTERVLVRAPGNGWRFRQPLVRFGAQARIGPYERKRLCAHGVTALWAGRAHTDDDNLLPDLLVGAGGLVDRERSATELLSNGGRLMFTDTARAVRWLRAAVHRTTEERQRADAMMLYASACALGERMTEAVESAWDLLQQHSADLDPSMLQQMEIVYATALATCHRWDELERLADWTYSPWPARQPGHEIITRAVSLVLLGHWAEGERMLQQWQHVWSASNVVTADFGRMFLGGARVLFGDSATIQQLLTGPDTWAASDFPQFAFECARHEVDLLLMLGELGLAKHRLASYSMSVDQLHGPDRFLVQWFDGAHSTALETARRSMTAGVSSARVLGSVVMCFDAARLLASRGWLSRARRMAESGRGPQLCHVLDHVQSSILRFLGSDEEADELLRNGLAWAEEHGYALGTEHMWGDLARRERELGAWQRAQECVRRTEELAHQFGTGHAELVRLVARAEVFEDASAGRAAVELARGRAEPYECAATFRRVALSGVDTERLLLESYELFGKLDALLYRAHLRTLLRSRNITVPGRNTATRENERLLAILVSEGLSNRQLATVFGTSEKSVEGRLTRMFAKSGYGSRVELTAALLRGEYTG